jgi:pectate lyase
MDGPSSSAPPGFSGAVPTGGAPTAPASSSTPMPSDSSSPSGMGAAPAASPGAGEGNPQVMEGLDGADDGDAPSSTASPSTPETAPDTTNPETPPSDPTPPDTTPPDTTPPETPPVSPPPVTPGAAEPTDCVVPPVSSRPIGYGAATTGGGNAAPVVVSSFAAAQAALDAYRDAFDAGTQNALVLRYTGSFDFASITDVCAQHTKDAQVLEIKEMENVTFEGARGSSGNFGLHINRAKNVIVRNMTLGLLPGGGDSDAITIEGNGTNGDVENVWIDHNELFSSTKEDCDGAGDTEFDGLIDIKKGARRITISYNYLHDHQKTGLIGFSDDDDTERFVTFHHNRYQNVVSRTPLHRFGLVHLFNNYYGDITSSGINVRMGGVALIESNFFENARSPVTSRYSDQAGFWDLRNNHVGPGISWDVEEDTLANADTWQSTTTFPANQLNYAYTPDRAGCVKQIVFAQAGAKL